MTMYHLDPDDDEDEPIPGWLPWFLRIAAGAAFIGAVCGLLLMTAGCAVSRAQTEETPAPAKALQTSEEYHPLSKEHAPLVVALNEEEVRKPILDATGQHALTDPAGNVVYQVEKKIARGLPNSPSRRTFEANDKFVDSSLSANMHQNADGGYITFSQVGAVNEESHDNAVRGVALRERQAFQAQNQMFGDLVTAAGMAAGRYFDIQEKEATFDGQAKLQENDQKFNLMLIERGILPPGFTRLEPPPAEASHGHQPAAASLTKGPLKVE